MKKEYIDFLLDLQKELNTQETDCQADPRFWGIMEKKEIWVPEDSSIDGYFLYYDENDWKDNEKDINDLKEYLIENEYFTKKKLKGLNTLEDIYDEIQSNDNIDDKYAWNYGAYRMEDALSQHTGAFLTKRAAKHHIEINSHNLSNPRTYAMTAFRNFEYEKLLKILKTVDWSKMEVTE